MPFEEMQEKTAGAGGGGVTVLLADPPLWTLDGCNMPDGKGCFKLKWESWKAWPGAAFGSRPSLMACRNCAQCEEAPRQGHHRRLFYPPLPPLSDTDFLGFVGRFLDDAGKEPLC